MNEFEEWLNKRCKVFIRNLSDKPIVYTGEIISVSSNFITILDLRNENIKINVQDIILIREETEDDNTY